MNYALFVRPPSCGRAPLLFVYMLSLAIFMLTPASAHATLFGFENITNNNAASAAIGEAQLFVDVYTIGNNAHFKFWNIGTHPCSITDVYFADGLLLTMDSIIDADEGGGHTGVDFERDAKPGNLPGGNDVGFSATEGFTADSDAPVPTWGVQASFPANEWLEIIFSIDPCSTPQHLYDELNSKELMIGIHVQAFEGGYSESFINGNTPSPGIPEPATFALLTIGSIALFKTKRRRT